jgi:hypothetical protein
MQAEQSEVYCLHLMNVYKDNNNVKLKLTGNNTKLFDQIVHRNFSLFAVFYTTDKTYVN